MDKRNGATVAVAALLLGIVLAGAVVTSKPVRSQDHSGHAQFHRDFYQHWKQPGSNASCCNARIVTESTVGTIVTGDCEPTQAEVRNGEWWARLPAIYHHLGDERGYIKVPESKRIRERNPTQGGVDAHLCFTPTSGILCFVPPVTGM